MSILVQKWIEALRSGRYKQAQHRLHKADGFCCLGVACNLFAPESSASSILDEITGSWITAYFGEKAFLPDQLRRSLGLSTPAGDFDGQEFVVQGRWTHVYSLADANDKGASFDEIAEIIESRPEGLFV